MTNDDRIAAWRRRYTAAVCAPNILRHEQQKAAGIDWRARGPDGLIRLDHAHYLPLEPVPRIGRLMRLVTWGAS